MKECSGLTSIDGSMGKAFHIVDQGGTPGGDAEGPPVPQLRPSILTQGDEGALLSAHKGTDPESDMDVKIKAGMKDIVSQKSRTGGWDNGGSKVFNGQGYSARTD